MSVDRFENLDWIQEFLEFAIEGRDYDEQIELLIRFRNYAEALLDMFRREEEYQRLREEYYEKCKGNKPNTPEQIARLQSLWKTNRIIFENK